MSWFEATVNMGMILRLNEMEKTVTVRPSGAKNRGFYEKADWKCDIGGIRWKITQKKDSPLIDTTEVHGWSLSGPCLILSHNYLRGSNLWEIDAELQYTIEIGSYRIQRVVSKKLDYHDWRIEKMIRLEDIDGICRIPSSSDESVTRRYKCSIILKLKIEMEVDQSKSTLTPTVSLLEEAEGFSDVVFLLGDGSKLYGNREILSMCSPYFEQHFDKNPNFSTMRIRNVAMEDFHGFLRMIFPSCERDFDENRIIEIMQLGVTYQVPRVLTACESFLIMSKDKHSDDQLNQYLKVAEEQNLNQLATWCFEKLYQNQTGQNDRKRRRRDYGPDYGPILPKLGV